jgi:integrase
MAPHYAVRTIMLASGERLPVLLDRAVGEPLFEPTVYSVSKLRSENQASNSIEAALRAVMVLYIFLELRHIDLNRRLREGDVLGLGEIEELVRLCRLPMKQLYALLATGEAEVAAPARVTSLEKHRMKQGAAENGKDVTSAASRVRYIRDYLLWLVNDRLSKHGMGQPSRVVLTSAGTRTTDAFNARMPSTGGRNTLGGREGIGQEAVDRLLEVIDPESPDNPWHGEFAKKRNQLAIHWLYELGIRRGELLGLEIAAINFANNTVTIERKADSVRDPRRRQPLTKTLDRVLPISERLTRMTNDYVIHVRKGKKAGLPHGFLIVASGTGAPLSLIGLSKVFEVLRAKCPDLPDELTPHVLRHTNNDLLSKKMDQKKIPEQQEEKLRSQLMGWKPTSKTASTYTKRHIREQASEVSLDMQNDIGKGIKNDK